MADTISFRNWQYYGLSVEVVCMYVKSVCVHHVFNSTYEAKCRFVVALTVYRFANQFPTFSFFFPIPSRIRKAKPNALHVSHTYCQQKLKLMSFHFNTQCSIHLYLTQCWSRCMCACARLSQCCRCRCYWNICFKIIVQSFAFDMLYQQRLVI